MTIDMPTNISNSTPIGNVLASSFGLEREFQYLLTLPATHECVIYPSTGGEYHLNIRGPVYGGGCVERLNLAQARQLFAAGAKVLEPGHPNYCDSLAEVTEG